MKTTKARTQLEMCLADSDCRKPYVMVGSEFVPQENTKFINIEEDMMGRDIVTFEYNGETHQSFVVIK